MEKIILEKEFKFFQSQREEWLKNYRGKFALIKGEKLIDVFSTLEDAYKEGVKRYGNQPFFIKKVEEEPIETLPALTLGIAHAYIWSSDAPDGLRRVGPIFPIEVSLPQTLADHLSKQGISIPPPIKGNALVDSGASISAVDLSVISSLQISPVGVATVLTTAGPAQQNLFPARFTLPMLVIDFSAVIGADLNPQGIIALIGRDLLSRLMMIYQGPAGRVTLAF